MSSRVTANPRDLGLLPLREESLDDAALVQDLKRARAQAAGARAGKRLVRAALDDGDVDACQCQFAGERQARRHRASDHDCMFFRP